ncbi:MAG: hypothetical protein ACOX5A_10330 [Aminivibrio sp.]|jgi:hypothetical protein
MYAELKFDEPNEESSQIVAIESVMQQRLDTYLMPETFSSSRKLLEPVLTKAFISQPILGNVILSEEQRTKIRKIAEDALSEALEKTYLKDYGLGACRT